jgi:hypothetical protein
MSSELFPDSSSSRTENAQGRTTSSAVVTAKLTA